jgi:predicted transcriptional regulator
LKTSANHDTAFTEQADAIEGIRQGLDDAGNGRLRPAKEVFEEFETG